jgi:peptide chain release factor 2
MTDGEVDEMYQIAMGLIDEMEFKSTITKQEDELNAILEINAGAGGTEACDWAAMLMRMYLMYAEKNGFKVSELSITEGDVVGIKSVALEITGDLAYGLLKGENGVHRLVRVSPYNSQGKRMTSFASVFVHPMVDDRIEITLNPADLEWDTFRDAGIAQLVEHDLAKVGVASSSLVSRSSQYSRKHKVNLPSSFI